MADILDVNSMRGKTIMLVGPMNSGKTEKAIRWAKNITDHTDCRAMFFKPDIDKRALPDRVIANTSEGKLSFPATTIPFRNPEAAISAVEKSPEFIDVVFFDEVNFFSTEIVDVLERLKNFNSRKRVVVGTGLNKNFRGDPFEPVPYAIAHADVTEMHQAYCKHIIGDSSGIHQCKKPANYTMRLVIGNENAYDFYDNNNNPVNGRYSPAKYYDPTVVIEKLGNNSDGSALPSVYYISVCSECFKIPGKEETIKIYEHIKEKGRRLEDLVLSFPEKNTGRIVAFLEEENKISEKNGILAPKEYFFDIRTSAYAPGKQ
jgi:thymidine kinase